MTVSTSSMSCAECVELRRKEKENKTKERTTSKRPCVWPTSNKRPYVNDGGVGSVGNGGGDPIAGMKAKIRRCRRRRFHFNNNVRHRIKTTFTSWLIGFR